MKIYRMMLLALAVMAFAMPVEAKKDKVDEYKPNAVYGDGKGGRRWGQFNQALPEKVYYQVKVKMRRVSGGDDTFVNLRFGKEGQTLDGSKRVYLKSNDWVEEIWRFDRTTPGAKPLILNAYNGEVEVQWVRAFHD
ncbi:MAG TPA: hypothetical protein PKE26_02610 [Kiritimatiellia bacterium]|nr:hypothetical protein [Kiritimatiellia bacterium]HMO97980.1 hypothetical protein [Kiritimatiellia bacterium]HMP95331.1 hypothetical protein [Kiritimatiellia bacterium]